MNDATALQLQTAGTPRIPLAVKVAYTAFLCVLVPYYWRAYGPANFLWFCDVALLLTLPALWLESPLLAGMPAVGIVLPQLLWVGDFLCGLLTGHHPLSMSEYMFDADVPLLVRGLSLFHGWLPLLLLWMVWRLGYDRRALLAQTALAWSVLLASFFVVADPTGSAGNVNKLFGPRDDAVQTLMSPLLWLGLLMAAYPALIYVPTHLVLRATMPRPEPAQNFDDSKLVT